MPAMFSRVAPRILCTGAAFVKHGSTALRKSRKAFACALTNRSVATPRRASYQGFAPATQRWTRRTL